MRERGRGFTLIELAIVLVVLGILAGIGAGIVGLLIKRIHYNQNRERLQANVEALVGYALTHHGKLPDDQGADNCTLYLRNTKDIWGKPFLCITADELVTDSACARKTTSLQVQDDNDNATHQNIAFVIISGGPNYNVQTSNNSTPIRIYLPGTPGVDDYPADMYRPEPYDDMVRYVSLDELKAKLKCPYTEEALRILNNELPYGFQDSSYNATVYATGGVPIEGNKYKWCVEDPDGLTATGITVYCDGNDAVNDNCSDPSASWQKCPELELSGSANSSGTYKLSFFVQDSDNNTAQKSLALTINPPISGGGGGGGCSGYPTYTVYNDSGNRLYWDCQCYYDCRWSSGDTRTISSSQTVTIHKLIWWWGFRMCALDGEISYTDARSVDSAGDCDGEVSYMGNGDLRDR